MQVARDGYNNPGRIKVGPSRWPSGSTDHGFDSQDGSQHRTAHVISLAGCLFSWLLNVQAACNVYLKDEPSRTTLRAATPRQKLPIKLAILPSRCILIPAPPFLAKTLQRQEIFSLVE